MTPFFFGSVQRRLFGIYEPAVMTGGPTRAAVLCHPLGAEYLHAHRTVRQLAKRLSAAGMHTLRFDYFGTGDSAGEMQQADLSGWEDDVELAIDELRDMVGGARVKLIGLRLGATLAARVASRRAGQIDALVLWDPILSGPDYVASLTAGATQAPREPPPATQGLPLTTRLHHDLMAVTLAPRAATAGMRHLTIVTESNVAHPGGEDGTEFIAAKCPWIEYPDSMGTIPVAVIRRIVDWLG